MATTKPLAFTLPDAGFRLTDARTIGDAIINRNGATSTYGITAAGTTQATATQLASVFNEVSTTAAATGVNLPLSTGRRNTPNQLCIIDNNGASALSVYGFQGSTDTINGTAGSTAFLIPAGGLAIFASCKPGDWSSTGGASFFPTAQRGTFTANGATPVTVTNANITANSQVLVTLKTVGGTVSVSTPAVQTITVGTGFTIAALASDTSVYNYAILG